MLSSAFSLNASVRQGTCKRSLFKSIVVLPENQRWLPNNNGFSCGTMHAIFSDSTFGMTMYVSLCGYMKWNNLN